MGATLLYDTPNRLRARLEGSVVHIDAACGCETLSWQSVKKLVADARASGAHSTWPIYEDLELVDELPIDEVLSRCESLAADFSANAPPRGTAPPPGFAFRWLDFVTELLGRGEVFVIFAGP